MKKLLIVLLFPVIPIFSQNAAEDDYKLITAGLFGGINFSQVDGDNYAGFHKLGFTFGPGAHINFNQNWSVSFELLFTQKGSRTYPDPQIINTYKLTMNYAEVPVMINYNDKQRLIFQAGITYGRLFSFKELINGYENLNNDDAFISNEFGYAFGGTIMLGPANHFGVNFRYQGSITSVGQSANPRVAGLINRLIGIRGVYYF